MKRCNHTKREVYLYLTGQHPDALGVQHPAKTVCSLVGKHKTTISKMINTFIYKDGLIKLINPNEYIKLYEATFRKFDDIYNVNEDNDKNKLNDLRPRREVSISKSRYEIMIEKEYSHFFEEIKPTYRGNCKHHTFKTKIFDEFDEWIFQKQGHRKVIIIVPRMYFTQETLIAARQTIFGIVFEALKWFAKKAKIKFKWETLHLCQKPHVESKAMSPKAKLVCRDFSLNIDGVMLDLSSGKADFETTVLDGDMVDTIREMEILNFRVWIRKELKKVRDDFGKMDVNYATNFIEIGEQMSTFEKRLETMEMVQQKVLKSFKRISKGMDETKKELQCDVKQLDPYDPMFA